MHREMEEAATATIEQATALVKQLAGRYLGAAPKEAKSAFREQLEASVSMDEVGEYIERVTELERVP